MSGLQFYNNDTLTLVDTPDAHTIEELADQFDVPVEQTVKTLVVEAAETSESGFVSLFPALQGAYINFQHFTGLETPGACGDSLMPRWKHLAYRG